MKHHPIRPALVAAGLALLAAPALALDLSWSGFATLGYARSDAPYLFQRSIDRNGTFDRDSVLAGQVDAKLSPEWSATLQLKAAPAAKRDNRWDLSASWAFIGWRPNNDWLLRAGRLRVPLYLHSETQDIGVISDMARPPNEMYWLTPTSDFTGLYATRSWAVGDGEFSADAYSGFADTSFRQWSRNGLPPVQPPGAFFTDVRVKSTGIVLTVRQPTTLWRAGLHRTVTTRSDGGPFVVRYPRVDLAPGVGYWQVDDALPGPGVPTVGSINNMIATVGADVQLPEGWRIAGEIARVRQLDTELGADASSAYATVFKTIDRFTPYVSASRLLSGKRQREWYARLSQAQLPPVAPGANQIVGLQQAFADFVNIFDQRSLAIGVSYSLTPSSKIKAEWMRTHIGAGSAMANSPPGTAAPHDTSLNVLSVNYSIAF